MQAAEGLSHVAIPADWLVGGEDGRQLLRLNSLPLRRPKIGAQQCGRMVEMLKRRNGLVAKDALLSFVPFHNDVPDEAILRVGLDLLETILATVLPLGPAGALVEPQGRFVKEGTDSSFSGGHVHGFRLLSLWASYQSLPAEFEEGAHSRDRAKHEQGDGESKDCNDNGENGSGHTAPRGLL